MGCNKEINSEQWKPNQLTKNETFYIEENEINREACNPPKEKHR